MNEIKQFSFYKNYYEIIRYLKNSDRLALYDAILDYMFENKEPSFTDLKSGIWINLKMPLDTSKKNSGRGGAPKGNKNASKKTTEKQPIQESKTTQKQTNKNISTFLFLLSNFFFNNISNNDELKEVIKEWLEYKEERKEIYEEMGLRKLLTQIDKRCTKYGVSNVIEVIDDSIANHYQGIIFNNLEKIKTPKSNNPFREIAEEEGLV